MSHIEVYVHIIEHGFHNFNIHVVIIHHEYWR